MADATQKHPAMIHMATLDLEAYDGPNKTCANCDDESESLIIFSVTGTDKNASTFLICAECLGEALETASNGEADSVNINVPA
ncbi:MAG TPA: hypothetical protein VLG09_03125 [Candidatus Saccharimonadales bacterium]|nr:hypothetical protein [Candidatus Saccharimonadales bacterium]